MSLGSPGTKFTTPLGKPASSKISISLYAVSTVSSAGFNNTVLPATTGANVVPAIIANGKFQGGMVTPVPIGL